MMSADFNHRPEVGNLQYAQRVLAMLHKLHKLGYQNLAIYTAAYGPGSWHCEIVPHSAVVTTSEGTLEYWPDRTVESAVYELEKSKRYFGWDDAQDDTAQELSRKFIDRFPRLAAAGKGMNFKYAGWLTYTLGKVEQGELPAMSGGDYQTSQHRIGSHSGGSLRSPPHNRIHTANGLTYARFCVSAEYVDRHDWHTAYIPIVTRMITQLDEGQVVTLPRYPLPADIDSDVHQTEILFELGAYWEGAIFFIQEILGYVDLEKFLTDHFDKRLGQTDRGRLFYLTWDSRNQLEFLIAHLIREYQYEEKTSVNEASGRMRQFEAWLAEFECRQGDGPSYPNPYFGGSNPLHLGLVLNQVNGERTLLRA